MTIRNKGQINIGQSGSKVIGGEKRESSSKAKVGKSGPVIVGYNKKLYEKYLKEKQRKKKRYDKKSVKDYIIIKFTNKLDEFNVLVGDNKISGRPWYYGLEGTWWWGMTEETAREKIISQIETSIQSDQKSDIDKIDETDEKIDDETDEKVDDETDETEDDKKIQTDIIPVPELQIHTVSEMIDQMTEEYSRNLPKDPKKRISYIYPLDSTHSFHIVATNHIKYLKNKYLNENRYLEMEEIDWSELSNLNWQEKRSVLIHPFLYPFASADSFIQNSKNFARLLAMKNKIGGFDVADSDKISKPAVDLINKIDLMMVPSNFVKEVYTKSGVSIPVEVLPHGVSDKFLIDDISDSNNKNIKKLRKMKKDKIFILYFLIHSGHRKGADLVAKVMKKIQKKHDDVYLVVRSKNCSYFSDLKYFGVNSWLSEKDLVALYDSCDICLVPSRGGGFEINAIESVSRGIPTLVTNSGCFLDLINYYIPIEINDKEVQPLPGNPIHTGYGNEADLKDFENKLEDVIENLDDYKKVFKKRSQEIREKFTWQNTAKILDDYLIKYGFITSN